LNYKTHSLGETQIAVRIDRQTACDKILNSGIIQMR